MLLGYGYAGFCCGRGVLGDEFLDPDAAEVPASLAGEQRVLWAAAAFTGPCPQDSNGLFGERCATVLSALAGAADVGADAELDVAVSQPGQLGHSKSSLHGEVDQGTVSPAGPGPGIGGVDQSGDLLGVEVTDLGMVGAFGGDGQHLGDHGGVLGMA
jgi:hypothetical protein